MLLWTKRARMELTNSAPVTNIRIPPASEEGCASRVDTACLTFSNGSDCYIVSYHPDNSQKRSTHRKLLYYSCRASYRGRLESQHGVISLEVLECCLSCFEGDLYVKRRQLLSVLVELVVVEFSELL